MKVHHEEGFAESWQHTVACARCLSEGVGGRLGDWGWKAKADAHMLIQ